MRSKRVFLTAAIAMTALAAAALGGCTGAPSGFIEAKVAEDTTYGGVYVDVPVEKINAAGFALGDSVDVIFSNGCSLEDIPYYNGYYVDLDEPLLIAYPGDTRAKLCYNYGDKMWEVFELEGFEGVRITLREAGKYKDVQDALSVEYTDERDDYPSDVAFSNYREMKGGFLKEGTFFRGASSVSNEHNRAPFVNELMETGGIAYDLDLSDNEGEVEALLAQDKKDSIDVSCFEKIYDAGSVGYLDLGSAWRSDSFKRTLSQGLYEMSKHDGPYYIHCIEGKDRTGFACALIEALAGASYDEIVDDYMETYANYYGFTEEGEPGKYNAIKELQIDNMLAYLLGTSDKTDLDQADFTDGARKYLISGGLSADQVSEIESAICS